jgi:cytoskeletal protein RodZ
MNTKKKFDLTTFFVILVSIGLILLGMYFLNQSFSKKSNPKVDSSNLSKTVSSSKKESSSTTSSSSESLESKTTSSENSSQPSSSSSVSSDSNSQNSDSSSSKNTSPLAKSEARIQVLESLGGGVYEVQVIESGLEKPIFWVKDKKLKINNSSTLKKDVEYRVSDITETTTSFNYDSILE